MKIISSHEEEMIITSWHRRGAMANRDCYSTSHPVSAGIGSSCHSQRARNTRERGLAQALSCQEAPGHFNDLMGAGKVTAEGGQWSYPGDRSRSVSPNEQSPNWQRPNSQHKPRVGNTGNTGTRGTWNILDLWYMWWFLCVICSCLLFFLNLFTHFCFYFSICCYLNLSPFPFNYHCVTHV